MKHALSLRPVRKTRGTFRGKTVHDGTSIGRHMEKHSLPVSEEAENKEGEHEKVLLL